MLQIIIGSERFPLLLSNERSETHLLIPSNLKLMKKLVSERINSDLCQRMNM